MPTDANQLSERTHRREWTHPLWLNILVAMVPVLACFLGGATEKWSEGIVLSFFGLLLLFNPPRHSLGLALNGTLVALALCGAIAFLPAGWFFQPWWQDALVNDFGIRLPITLSPQPWITLGCLLSFLGGLSWFYYICARDAGMHEVRFQVRFFAGGVVLLAAICILFAAEQTSLPFWHNQRGFGPFPNRNQTGDLLGITAIMLLASGQDDFRRGRTRWVLSVIGFGIIVAALILNFSRAGILILVGGSVLWLTVMTVRNASSKGIGVAISMVLILLTALLIFGGSTIDRFHLRPIGNEEISSDFRWLIFHDTWQMIRASPWCGLGLGIFEPIFALSRVVSVSDTRSIHPESDWLWLWSEMGWVSVVLVLAGMVMVIRHACPLREGTNQRFRLAALIASLIFASHGLIDVSAHRVGTAFAGLFLFGLVVHRPFQFKVSRSIPIIFRFIGVGFFATGAAWLWAERYDFPLPGSIGVKVMRESAEVANRSLSFEEVITDSNRGLEWAPLDWQLYFLRALGKVGARQPTASAVNDFQRARFLEPNAYEVPFAEGKFWLPRRPVLALTAWREALRRAGPRRTEIYGEMFFDSGGASDLFLRGLAQLAGGDPELVVAGLTRVSQEQFKITLKAFLGLNPGLQGFTATDREKLFRLWAERGDLEELARLVETYPDWRGSAWEGLAKLYANDKNFQAAVEMIQQFAPAPVLPSTRDDLSIEELKRNVYSDPTDYSSGLSLYQKEMAEGKIDDALGTVRHFTALVDPPAYFHFLEAQCWIAKHDWERAWKAWVAFRAAK